MKILVSGAAGYIASRLIPHLIAENHTVIGVDNLFYNQPAPQVLDNPFYEFYRMDVRDNRWLQFLPKVDAVIHLAALVGMPVCRANLQAAVETNFEATGELVANLSKNQLLIYPNSNSAYGTSSEVCTEESPFNPLSLYAQTKMDGERCALRHENTVVFRLATVFGVSPRMRLDLLVNDWAYQSYFNRRLEVYEPDARRNFVHIMDVCRCFSYTLRGFARLKGEVFNLGNDNLNMSKKELANSIYDATHLACSVPTEISFRDGEDFDKRNYVVSSTKLFFRGFQCNYGFWNGLTELYDFFQTLPKDDKEREQVIRSMRNA